MLRGTLGTCTEGGTRPCTNPSPRPRRPASRTAGLAAGLVADDSATAQPATPPAPPLLTPARDFQDVSRGNPLPHSLRGDAHCGPLGLRETWRLEILAENGVTLASPKRLEDGTALDFAALLRLGERHSVRFLKAMQCNNIARPLGQGLWEVGVLLRANSCTSASGSTIRVGCLYWGFHNNDPAQVFRSSLAINQVFDSPPGELVPFVAYRLNGGPIPPRAAAGRLAWSSPGPTGSSR